MKVKGPEDDSWAQVSGAYRSRVVLGGPQIASCGLGFGWGVVDRHDSAGFWVRGVVAGGCGVLARSLVSVRLLVGAGR
jgi:hypothetical protein